MPKPVPAASETGDPLLLTPGPLTTGKRVKEFIPVPLSATAAKK